jgi:hypothetical protein
MEHFYSLRHLNTEQLRELFSSYRRHGWLDTEYHRLTLLSGPPAPSNDEILSGIDADSEHNYCVFMFEHEDEADGVMIGFGLSNHADFSVYLHLPAMMLPELVEKYALSDLMGAWKSQDVRVKN